jgi:hypothetical protein
MTSAKLLTCSRDDALHVGQYLAAVQTILTLVVSFVNTMTHQPLQVFHQRLLDEFNMPVLLTTPNVPYTFVDTHTSEQQVVVNLGEWHSASTDSSGSSKRMVSNTHCSFVCCAAFITHAVAY